MKSQSTIRLLISMVLAIGGLILTGAIASSLSKAAAADTAYPNSTITSIEGLPPGIAANCDRVFANRKNLPPGQKKTMLEAEFQACINALPPSRVTLDVIPTVRPIVPANILRRAAGLGTIVDDSQAPFSTRVYVIQNRWYRIKPNEILSVYAGAKKHDDFQGHVDTLQGVVVINAMTPAGQPIPEDCGEYLTPVALGPVRIVDAQGEQLSLVAADGTGFFFNVASHRFVTPGPASPVTRISGNGTIVETKVTNIPIMAKAFENQWFEDKQGSRITVFAGASEKGSRQGLLVVVVTAIGNPNTVLEERAYPAPIHFGSLRIVDADGERLTLATHNGRWFVFDVATRQYISWPVSPLNTAATMTPLPLAYP